MTHPDRRPIGISFFAQTEFRTKENPRGFFDAFVKDPEGYLATTIRMAKEMNCQGILTWDIEGQEHDHPNSYVGDPLCNCPEIPRARVKQYVADCKAAGLWNGFTIRHTRGVLGLNGKARRVWCDPVDSIVSLIQDCRFTYGDNVRAFYIDDYRDSNNPGSNAFGTFGTDVFAAIFKKLEPHKAAGYSPLLIPEFYGPGVETMEGILPARWVNTQPSRPFQEIIFPDPKDRIPTAKEQMQRIIDFKLGDIPAVTVNWDAPWNKYVMDGYRRSGGV